MNFEIPIIDFESCHEGYSNESHESYSQVGRKLYEAFSTSGFAYLKNSGITRKCVDKVNEVTGIFFQCPTEQKQKFYRNPETNFGYVGIASERVDPDKPGDYKEAFDMSGDASFREDAIWPDNLAPGFSVTAKEFMLKCKELAIKILDVLSYGMQLEDGHGLASYHKLLFQSGNITALRSLYYPPLPDPSILKPGQLRLGEHSDYGTITLLFQDDVGGLQVQTTDGQFIDAVPIEDTVLINIGDMLQFQTCGKLKSTVHRVRMPSNEKESNSERRSLVCFVYADREVVINKPLTYKPGVKGDSPVKNGKPITSIEYTMSKWNSTIY